MFDLLVSPLHPCNSSSPMCGGKAPTFVGRYEYYVSFIDDYSKFSGIYVLKNKSEVFEVI
jgi:hypothetical protein